jgi:hypothetical protein
MADEKPNVSVFDNKAYNPQAFGRYIQSIPKTRKNELEKANIFTSDNDIKNLFQSQSTAVYAVQPMIGEFNGNVQNLDGETDLEGGELDTYYYGITSYSRAITGKEKDYTKNIIPGLDPLDQIANKFADKWDDVNEDTLVSIIKGVFASTTDGADEFVENHTLEVDKVDETSIYDATQKACGDQNQKFSMSIMHSKIANELAKKQLLEYIKYTDAQGIQRNTNIAQWGDKTVLVDDTVTTEGSGETLKYITYVLGNELFDKEDLSVEQPFERYRNALKNGGLTYLISRSMQVRHPRGFSYLKKSQAKESPTDAEFANGANWGLAKSADGTKYYPHKMIPLARIVSKG